jgi:hypothetical protein
MNFIDQRVRTRVAFVLLALLAQEAAELRSRITRLKSGG